MILVAPTTDETRMTMSETLPFAALVFDVGGVIIPHDNDVLYRLLAQRCRGASSPAAVEALVRDPRYERGELPIAHLHQRLLRIC